MLSFVPPDKNDSFTRIVLDGEEYLFKFSYNYDGGFWTMGVYADERTAIIAGVKIVPSFPINWHFRQYIDLPNGVIGVVTSLEKIGRKDFMNGKAKFVYLSTSEIESYLGGADSA